MSQPTIVSADPILCHCFKVRQSTVDDCVTLLGASTVQEVRGQCGASGGCMACRRRIQNIIDQKNSLRTRLSQE